MATSKWQKQHVYFQGMVWGISAAFSILVMIVFLSLGFKMEVAGVFFILTFAVLRILLALLLNNRYANSMIRVLKFDYADIERDLRMMFKNKYIRFYRKSEEELQIFEFPEHRLSMTVQPYWLSYDSDQPATKLTLRILNAKNTAFAEMLAESIDEMVNQRTHGLAKAQ